MEKLELKHIAHYLPYGLECILSHTGIFNLDNEFGTPPQALMPMKIINLCIFDRIEIELHSKKTNWGVGFIELDEIKPILRPLSDLAKEIEHNGEKFFPIDKLRPIDSIIINKTGLRVDLIKEDWERLYSWHFDVNNLIGKDLAIDINTL